MTVTINLAPDEEAQLQAHAAQQGLPPEEYIRTVLRHELGRDEQASTQEQPPKTVAEMLKGRIGQLSSREANHGQPSHTAENTGEEFTKILVEKYRKQGLKL